VVVAGAGPAGSVAALVLARGGARVALVDKAAFPRDKACGDLVGPRGVGLLDELDSAGRLTDYHLMPATRADLLRRLGRHREAAEAYRRALDLATSDADRRYLTRRLQNLPR